MSAAVAGLSGTIAGLLFGLRCAGVEDRQHSLEAETQEGLKAVCVGLRVRASGSKEKLIQLIQETIVHDEAMCDPSTPTGKIVGLIGRIPDQVKVAGMLSMRFNAADLKEVCKELRLPRTGRKAEMAERITRETYELWRAWQTPSSTASGGGGAPPAPAGQEAGAAAQDAAAVAAVADPAPPAAAAVADPAPLSSAGAGVARGKDSGRGRRSPRGSAAARAAVVAAEEDEDEPGAAGAAPGDAGGRRPAQVEMLFAQRGGPAQWVAPDSPAAAAAAWDDEQATPGSRRAANGTTVVSTARGSAPPAQELPAQQPPSGAAAAAAAARGAWAGSRAAEEAPRQAAEPGGGVPQEDFVRTKTIMGREEKIEQRKAQRFVERRMKLVGYLAEEIANTFGGEKERYIKDMKGVLKEVPDASRELYLTDKLEEPTTEVIASRVPGVLGPEMAAPECASWHSEPVRDRMEMVGELGPARQGWCKWWDKDTGCGEIVDLDDQSPVAVVSAALTTGANVSPRLKYLRNGEFVEYRRVFVEPSLHARAVLVRGLKGWPLMCEVVEADDGSRSLPA